MPSKERITPNKKLKHKQCNTFKPHFPCAILNCLASTSWLMIRKFGWVKMVEILDVWKGQRLI